MPLVGSVNYISSCDDDPDSSGTWIVSEDIEVSLESDETCIDILSDDVAIVCGNLIEGNGLGTAIDVNGYNNAIIKNCFISNFETGIALSGATDTRLINNVIY